MKFLVITFACILVQFNLHAQNNDPLITALIKRTETQMGGQKALDDVNNLSWNFFNIRSLTWNKRTGDVRIDWRSENSVYLINTETKTGRILKNGKEVTNSDSLSSFLKDAYEMWINDSYWLLMPFKLNDPGVKLTYLGNMTSKALTESDVLELTFNEVGVTPNNKYLIYIDKITGLVNQWDYFNNKTDAQSRFSTTWQDYKSYGKVKLSGDRGDRKITEIRVFKRLDDSVYKEFKRPTFLN
jgi:hypothetical protein